MADGLETGTGEPKAIDTVQPKPQPQPGGEPGGQGKPVMLTQEQIDAMFDKGFGRAFKKANAEFAENYLKPLEGRFEQLRAEFEPLRKLVEQKPKGDKGEARGDQEAQKPDDSALQAELDARVKRLDEEHQKQLQQLQAEVQAKSVAIQTLLEQRKRQALEIAAASHRAIDPSEVAKLLLDDVMVDENWDLYVRSDKSGKSRRINDKGEFMSVNELVKEFLEKKPYMVQPEYRAGGGATPVPVGSVPDEKAMLQKQLEEARKKGDVSAAIRLERRLKFGAQT